MPHEWNSLLENGLEHVFNLISLLVLLNVLLCADNIIGPTFVSSFSRCTLFFHFILNKKLCYVMLCYRWPRAASHCRHVLSACVEFVLAQFVWRIFPNNSFLFCHNDDHFRTIAASGSGATETLTSSEAASVKGVTSNKLLLFVLLFMFAGSKCRCKLVLS